MVSSLSPTTARPHLPFAAKLALSILPCVIVLGAAEVVLRLTGCGYPAGFFLSTDRAGRKTLIENTRFAWRFMPQQTARAPLSFQFHEEKPHNHFRIFVFGESAAMPIFESLKNWIVDIQGVTKEQNGLGTTFSSPVVL